MFFLIGGVEQKRKELRTFNNCVCACGRMTSAVLVVYYSCFHLFFIPLFKWNKRYYVVSRCCGPYECPEIYAEDLLYDGGTVDFSKLRKKEPHMYYNY